MEIWIETGFEKEPCLEPENLKVEKNLFVKLDIKESKGLLVSQQTMELDDEFIFFLSEIATLEIRAQIVYPPQSATLATSK